MSNSSTAYRLLLLRQLGARYLWVDALCIFQDDKVDQAWEIGGMAGYYDSARVTICAAAAARWTDGFLGAPHAAGPIRLSQRDSDGRPVRHVYLLEEESATVERTATRAWTLQESLLSRQLLVFSGKQLYWCFPMSFGGCGGERPAQLVDRVTSP